jgi:hypothetical protein
MSLKQTACESGGREEMTEGDKGERKVPHSAADCFRAALRQLLDDQGYGAQVRLSKGIGRGTKHLNDVVRGRRTASMEFQERVAAFFKITPEEMIAMGRKLLKEKGKNFPYAQEAENFPEREDRADFIYRKTLEEAGLEDNRFFSRQPLKDVMPTDWSQYVSGTMDEYDLYTRTKEELKLIGEVVSKRLLARKRKSCKKDLICEDAPRSS